MCRELLCLLLDLVVNYYVPWTTMSPPRFGCKNYYVRWTTMSPPRFGCKNYYVSWSTMCYELLCVVKYYVLWTSMCREVLCVVKYFVHMLSSQLFACYVSILLHIILLCLHMLKNSLSPSATPSIWALQSTVWRLAAVALWIAKKFTKSKSKCLKL